MSTELQKRLAINIIKNAKNPRPKNKTELVISSGYAPESAKNHAPTYIDQKGVREYLKELGFNADNAKRVVTNILHKETAKDQDRLKAADMIFNVEGTYAPDKSINMNVSAEELRKTIQEDLQRYRSSQ